MNQQLTVFFDNGCSDFIIKHAAAELIKPSAKQVYAGNTSIGGVGNSHTVSKHGIYTVKIPLYDGEVASMSGICLDRITSQFPMYPLGEVEKDVCNAYRRVGGDLKQLPKLPTTIGGEVDIMIGIKYLRYHPKPVFQLPSGLCIYESMFQSADGSRGIIGGPHEIFSRIQQQFYGSKEKKSFFAYQYQSFKMGFKIDLPVPFYGSQPA